jgi:hypothetical protein
MPTNIAPLITGAAYDAVINIPSNGETITEAAEINTVVALGNRIEFIRNAVPSIAASPEKHLLLADDFMFVDSGAIAFGTPRNWLGDTHWMATQLTAGTLAVDYFNAAHTNNHGCMVIQSSSGTTGLELRKGSIGANGVLGVRCTRLLSAKCIVKLGNVSAPMKFEVGMQKGSTAIRAANTASLSFFFDPTVSGNWQARSSQTAALSEHLTDLGVAPGGGAFQKLEIRQVEEADITYEFLINDVVRATKRQSAGAFFIPTGAEVASLRLAGQVPVFAANEQIIVDYVHFTLNSGGR